MSSASLCSITVKFPQYSRFSKRTPHLYRIFIQIKRTRTLYQYPSSLVVPKAGLEPARYRYQRILSPSRLPFHHFGKYREYVTTFCEKKQGTAFSFFQKGSFGRMNANSAKCRKETQNFGRKKHFQCSTKYVILPRGQY